ncbi:unnamed protein product [Bursaphelenchus xylophilus]|uniref:(pine wood nematode) hypothetical protein n=1 Tax=Bursaphelenchus xylophilus TaxID=6326 RepID=A0A7I8X4K4_BURXY|nr:unnamed protein product [Bursaphelenchus xylophilus]CAG9129144.1 unnamed protein product [Bursaphelenchus xylophilus]
MEAPIPMMTHLKVPRSLSHGLKSLKPIRRASLSPQLDESPRTLLEVENYKLAAYDPNAKTKYLTQQFELHELLGRGSFGQVYGAKCKRTGNFFAVKKALHQCSKTMPEIEILHQLAHPKIIQFYGAWKEAEFIFMVLEICTYPLSYVMKVEKGEALELNAWRVLADVGEALAHLHLNGVIHNDVKPDNILVAPNGIYKLADFNVSIEWKEYSEAFAETLPRGDDRYSAPECILKHIFCDKTDIYAFGATLLNFLIGRPSEPEELEMENLDNFLAKISVDLRQILRKMLDHDHEARPAARDLLLHENVVKNQTESGRGPILSDEQITQYESELILKNGDDYGQDEVTGSDEHRRWILEDEYVTKTTKVAPKRVSLRSLAAADKLNTSVPTLPSESACSPVLRPKRLSLRGLSDKISMDSDPNNNVCSPISKRSRPAISLRIRALDS